MLTLLAILIIGGIMLFGAGGIFMFFRWAFFGDQIKEKKLAAYRESLPDRFDGSQTVVWDLPNYPDAPTKEQLIKDAEEHGYELDHVAAGRYDQSLIFKMSANK